MRHKILLFLFIPVILFTSCIKSPEEAKHKLKEMGFDYNEESFLVR